MSRDSNDNSNFHDDKLNPGDNSSFYQDKLENDTNFHQDKLENDTTISPEEKSNIIEHGQRFGDSVDPSVRSSEVLLHNPSGAIADFDRSHGHISDHSAGFHDKAGGLSQDRIDCHDGKCDSDLKSKPIH